MKQNFISNNNEINLNNIHDNFKENNKNFYNDISNLDKKNFQITLAKIFIEEFTECFNDMLIISQNEFFNKFIHRINIIIKSYYPSLINYLYQYPEIFTFCYKIILNEYYLPIKKLVNNNNKKKIFLKNNFQPHCELTNPLPLHSCLGNFILIPDNNNNKFVVCNNCKYIYSSNNILMYCKKCDCEYLSCIKNKQNNNLNDILYKPATWDKYHCPIVLNQQMICQKCNINPLFIINGTNNKLYCKKCKITFDPYKIDWKCIICNKIFNTGFKEYNVLDFLSTKISVKNAIVNKKIIKPLELPCNCEKNFLKNFNFVHNDKCKGLLYEGKIFEEKIVVCGKCKTFANVNNFVWICPMCKKGFRCNNTRSFNNDENNEEDEFKIDYSMKILYDNDDDDYYKEENNISNINNINNININNSHNFKFINDNQYKDIKNYKIEGKKQNKSSINIHYPNKKLDLNVNYSNIKNNNRYEIEKEYSPIYTNKNIINTSNNVINIKYFTKNNSPIVNKQNLELTKNNSPISTRLYKKKFVKVLNNNNINNSINNNNSIKNNNINNYYNNSINNNTSIKKFLYQKHKSNIIEYNNFLNKNELEKSKEKSLNNSLNKINNSLINNENKINIFKNQTKNNSPKLLTNSNSNLLSSQLKNFYLHNNSNFNISFNTNNNNNINNSSNIENISPVKYIPTNPNNNHINFNKINIRKNLISSSIKDKITVKKSSSIPLFNINDYIILSQLGEGSFAKIYLVSHKITHKTFCLKKILTSSSKEFTEMSKEFEIFYKYKHNNILSILAISKKMLDQTTYCIYILTEVAKTDWEKEINNRLARNKFYSENELINILKQLTSALLYLQKNNIAHRDIKAQNILIFPERIFKLADFGEAKKFEKNYNNYNNINNINTSTLRGTELYMSPILFEGLKNKIFDLKYNPYKSDVFSLGMCLLFAGTLRIRVLCKIRDCKNDKEIERLIRGLLGKRYGENFINLIIGMLKIKEEDRYDFENLNSILDNYVINDDDFY